MQPTAEAVVQILGFLFLILAATLIAVNTLRVYRYARDRHGPSSVVLVPSILGVLGLRLLVRDGFGLFLRWALVIIALDFGPLLVTAVFLRLFGRRTPSPPASTMAQSCPRVVSVGSIRASGCF